jgi:hypothetical protein
VEREIEFLDAEPPPSAPVEELRAGSPRRSGPWIVAAVTAAAVVVAAVVVASDEGNRTATPPISATPSVPVVSPPVVVTSPAADAPSIVYLGGCTACAHFPSLPAATTRALRATFPDAKVERASSVVSSQTGRLFTSSARLRVGRGVVTLDVRAATGIFETTFTQIDDRITVQVGVSGFRIVLRSVGVNVDVGDLIKLGEDSRLLAA